MNPTKIFCTRTAVPSIFRTVQLGIVFAGLACLVVLASVTTPASAQAVNFGKVNVCPAGKTTPAPCNANQTVTFSIPAGTKISSVKILTTGTPGLDYIGEADDTSATLCKAKTYSSATTCTVDVRFSPLAPGVRKGAVELLDGTSVLDTTYIYGTGVGPQIAFSPVAPTTFTTYFAGHTGSTVDASGNLFLVGDNGVEERLAKDSYGGLKHLWNQSSIFDGGIAVDGAGNLFFQPVGSFTSMSELVAAEGYALRGLSVPGTAGVTGVAVDGSGNLFVSQVRNGVVEFLAAGGFTTAKTVNSSLINPAALALDASNNVFVVDGNAIKEILAEGGYTTVKTLAGSFSGPTSVALDAAGNLYVYDADAKVYEMLAAEKYTTIKSIAAIGQPGYMNSLAVDGKGNLFLAEGGDYGPIVEFPRSQPPGLNFNTTILGSTSTNSPLSVTAQNTGNASLIFSGLSLTDDTDFSLVPASNGQVVCSVESTLAPSEECKLKVDFNPQSAGPLTGEINLTDNSSNATDSSQSIALSGIGTTVEISPAVLNFGSVPFPGTASQTLTITNVGTGTLSVNLSSNGPSTVITGSTCGANIAAGKRCLAQVEFKPARLGPNSNTVTVTTNQTATPILPVPVSGTSSGVGSLTTSLDFSTVIGRGNSTVRPLMVTNYAVPGSVTVATETGAASFNVFENDCTSGVTAGNSCTIFIEYEPAALGTQTAYLKLIPSSGAVQNIKLTGTHVPY